MPSATIIPASKLVNLGNTTIRVPMLCETEELDLPEGLETFSTIVSVKSGPNHRLKVPFLNNSKHGNTQQKISVIGILHDTSSGKRKKVYSVNS